MFPRKTVDWAFAASLVALVAAARFVHPALKVPKVSKASRESKAPPVLKVPKASRDSRVHRENPVAC